MEEGKREIVNTGWGREELSLPKIIKRQTESK